MSNKRECLRSHIFAPAFPDFLLEKKDRMINTNNVSKLTFTVMGFILGSNTQILHFFPSQKPLCAVGGW